MFAHQHRLLIPQGLLAVVSIALLAAVASAKERPWHPPRLADGHVDLQGVWAHTNSTPFERPADIKTFAITPAEAQAIKAKADAKADDLSRPDEPSLYFDDLNVEPIRREFRSSIVVDPADGKIPGNEAFRAKMSRVRDGVLKAFDGPEQRPISERCLGALSSMPPVQLIPAGDLRQIVQTPDTIAIVTEELHEARIVRMNAKHAPAAIQSWEGDSIGRWEGDTLVIETKYFSPASETRASFASAMLVSPATTITERLTRVSADEMSYVFTVDDPTYYTQPWTGETRFHRSTSPMIEYACHEGNYALGNVLMGARAAEARAAEKEAGTATR
jgi:hypothetical protein